LSFERVETLNYSAVLIDATMEANLDDIDTVRWLTVVATVVALSSMAVIADSLT
jgi:hypothetical protein